MSRRTASILAWTLVGLSVMGALTEGAMSLAVERDSGSSSVGSEVVVVAVFLVSAVVGGLVASRLPSNPIGWVFVTMVTAVGLSAAADGYVAYSLDRGRDGGLVPYLAEYSDDVFVAFFAMVFYSLLLFPDGRLLTRRWRAVLWAGSIGLVLCTISIVINPGKMDDYPELTSPTGIDSPIVDVLFLVAFVGFGGALVAAAVSIVLRFRRARGVERQQLTVLLAVGVAGTAAVVVGVIATVAGWENLGIAVTMLGVLAIPVGIGVAMLRYRLYDVDRLISRSLTYALVTALLLCAYAALVLGGQTLFSSFAGGSDFAIAISTLVVAALFLPLRSRVQRTVDRRFNRRRYDAQRTLAAFGAKLREQVELDELRSGLQATVHETMQPAHVALWLRAEAGS
jgi:histidine kinase-like protein